MGGIFSTYKALKPLVCSHRAFIFEKIIFSFSQFRCMFYELRRLYIEIIELGKLFPGILQPIGVFFHRLSSGFVHSLASLVG